MKLNKTISGLILTAGLTIGTGAVCSAQTTQDVNGKVYRTTASAEVSGDPYFYSEFVKGSIKFKSGKPVEAIQLKYDLLADVILYQDSKGVLLEVADPVHEFTLASNAPGHRPVLFRNGFKPVNTFTEQSFYEVLWDGKIKLLKKSLKYITEDQGYTGIKQKVINDKVIYFLVKGAETIPVNLNEKSISTVLGIPKADVSAFVKENKLDLKKDSDLTGLIEHLDH